MNVFELALAAAVITMTITRSSLFIPIRRLLKFKIFKCPYCFVHWVSASLALFLSGFWILTRLVLRPDKIFHDIIQFEGHKLKLFNQSFEIKNKGIYKRGWI